MRCPNCGSEEQVCIDSRMYKNNWQRRRRECNHCGTRWTTFEISAQEYRDLKERDKKLMKVMDEAFNILKGSGK